jgi:hypothetical protein
MSKRAFKPHTAGPVISILMNPLADLKMELNIIRVPATLQQGLLLEQGSSQTSVL